MSSSSSPDVAVIGAGFAGLGAAALLARRGVTVEAFESAPFPGGRARSVCRDGFILDHGIHGHRFGADGPAARLLRELGEDVEWVDEEGARSYLIRDGEWYPAPVSVSDFLSLPMLVPADRARLIWIVARMAMASPDKHSRVSLADFVGGWASRPSLRPLLKALGAVAMAPDIEKASAGEVIELIKRALRAERPLGTAKGGEGQVIGKLVRNITAPSRLRLTSRVRKIHVQAGKVVGVETRRGLCKPKAVIHAAPIQRLFRLIDRDIFNPDFVRRAESLEPTAGISVDMALDRPVSDVDGGILDLDDTIMGKFPSVADPSLAPQGKQLATWLWVLDTRKLKDREFLKGARDEFRKKIERLIPGILKAVTWERWLYFPILDGAHLKVGQAWRDRQPLRSEQVTNLFFAGDTVAAPGVGGDVAFESALRVAGSIVEWMGGK